ncbi:MAG TPA: YbfB/YjiJ family MFS transporter, partial [Stellaceae bacterium]|nr:YbfB/YjiJ family MFS transporter [Stellaceae bacterium]
LVDYIARGLGHGLEVGAHYWVIFGVGAISGPVLISRLSNRIGFNRALKLLYAAQGLATLLLALSGAWPVLAVASLVLGGMVPGISSLLLGTFRELMPGDLEGQQEAWRIATIGFALGQAAGTYGFAFLLARSGRYDLLYALASLLPLLALVISARRTALR